MKIHSLFVCLLAAALLLPAFSGAGEHPYTKETAVKFVQKTLDLEFQPNQVIDEPLYFDFNTDGTDEILIGWHELAMVVTPSFAILEWNRENKTFKLICQDNGSIAVYEAKVNGYHVLTVTSVSRAGPNYEESVTWYTFANGQYQAGPKPDKPGKVLKQLMFE